MTVVSAGCLQEEGTGPIELSKGFITDAWRERAVQNPIVRYILQQFIANAVAWLKVAGGGIIKRNQLCYSNITMHWLGTTIICLSLLHCLPFNCALHELGIRMQQLRFS